MIAWLVNAPGHRAPANSNWLLQHDSGFAGLRRPAQAPDLSPTEHLRDVLGRELGIVDVPLTNQQRLSDAVVSIWSKMSEECFQHLVGSVTSRMKAVPKATGVPTRH